MKKLLAMLLVLSMLFAFVACGGDDDKLPIDDAADSDTDGNTDGETDGGDETEKDDEPEVYTPDPDAKYGGMVGIGTETGTAYFDNLKVLSKQADKMLLVEDDLEGGAMPTFTYAVSIGGDWDKDTADYSLVADPTKEYTEEDAEEDKNHVITYNGDGKGAFAYMGDKEWNYYQYTVKVLPADENAVINLYFCIEDENNYFVLSLCENGNTQADCYRVVDGVKETAAFKINNSLSLEEWTSIGITVEREIIDIYIGGQKKMSIFNPEFINQYYPYDGEIIPSSIAQALYGAPGENLTYFQVAAENVMHDGKGTWGSNTANVATMAFDMDYSTYYDCDEKCEDEGTEGQVTDDELVGIPGDGTHASAYVGAYIPEGFKLTHIRYAPRADQTARMPGGIFEASVDGTTWVQVGSVESAPAANDYATIAVEDNETVYKYLRYTAGADCYGNVAEIEIWGHPAE